MTGGTHTVDNGKITFTPGATFGQADAVAYRVANGLGETAIDQCLVGVTTITLTAADDSATTVYKTQVTVDVPRQRRLAAPRHRAGPLVAEIINSNGDAVTSLKCHRRWLLPSSAADRLHTGRGIRRRAAAGQLPGRQRDRGHRDLKGLDHGQEGVPDGRHRTPADTAFRPRYRRRAGQRRGRPGVTLDASRSRCSAAAGTRSPRCT